MPYKVTNKYMRSATVDNGRAVEYKLNEFVYPKVPGEYLFCFEELALAQQFIQGSESRYDIYECECQGVHPNPREYLIQHGVLCNSNIVLAYGVKLTKLLPELVKLKSGDKLYNDNTVEFLLIRNLDYVWQLVSSNSHIYGNYDLSKLDGCVSITLEDINSCVLVPGQLPLWKAK